MRLLCPHCATVVIDLDVMKMHVETIHPDIPLAGKLHQLKAGHAFYLAASLMSYFLETTAKPLPQGLRRCLHEAHMASGLTFPDMSTCPASIAEAVEGGWTLPATHGLDPPICFPWASPLVPGWDRPPTRVANPPKHRHSTRRRARRPPAALVSAIQLEE